MEIGVQIYGAKEEFRKNPQQFLTKMRQAGVMQIEPCVFFDDPIAFHLDAVKRGDTAAALLPATLWLPQECPALAQQVRDMGMRLHSAHAFFTSLTSCGDKLLDTAEKMGISAYVLNTPAWALENPEKFADQLDYLADALAELEVQLWLHNSGADIAAQKDGVPVYAWLLNRCKRLYAQPDTGWVQFGGQNPVTFIQSIGHKVRSLHFKDLDKGYAHKTGTDIFAVLGQGCVDQQGVLQLFLGDNTVTRIIDQDASKGDFFADIASSVLALTTSGYV